MEQRKRWRAALLVVSAVLASVVVLRRDAPAALNRLESVSVQDENRSASSDRGSNTNAAIDDVRRVQLSADNCKEASAETDEGTFFASARDDHDSMIVASPLDRFLAESLRSLVRSSLSQHSVDLSEPWEDHCAEIRLPPHQSPQASRPGTVRDLCWLIYPSLAFSSLSGFVAGGDAVKLLIPPPYTEGDPASWAVNEQGAAPPGTGRNRTADETRYMKAELGAVSTPHPSTFSSTGARLVSLKRYFSFSIRSLSADERLQRAWKSAVDQGTVVKEARNIRRFLYGLVSQWTTTIIAVARSATPGEQRLARRGTTAGVSVVRHRSAFFSSLLRNYARLTMSTASCQLERAWLRAASSDPRVHHNGHDETRADDDPIVSIHRDTEPNRPLQEDLWAPFEPQLRCHSMWRECEHPDGCRFSCNTEYLLYATAVVPSGDHRLKASPALSYSTPTRYRHVFIGSGSNNDFMWESNLVRLFSSINETTHRPPNRTASASIRTLGDKTPVHAKHTLRFLATFDCTLRDSPCPDPLKRRVACLQGRHWMPPSFLKSNGADVEASWVQGSVCLGSHPSAHVATLPDLREILRPAFQHGQEAVFAHRRQRGPVTAGANETSVGQPAGVVSSSPQHSIALDRDVRWFPSLSTDVHDPQNYDKEASRVYRSEVFDDVSLLKIDIEEGEYRTLGQWLRAVIRGIDMFSVSQLQLEVHRTVSRVGTPEEVFSKAYWWMEYLRWELAALGFQLVSREKNYFGRRAYEWLLVHHTYFARSEQWMELRV